MYRIIGSPTSSPAKGPHSRSAAIAAGTDARPVLLVVDDDDGVREALHLILDKDYTVLDVGDGRTALRVTRAQHIDLMVLDILMPDVDGIEILHELRAFEPDLPVIIMTAVKTVVTAVAAMKLGATDYITKPFQEATLLAAIRSALEQHRARRSTRPDSAQPPHQERLTRPWRFLLVGDDLGWRATLSVVLERLGRLETASTLDEALNHLFRLRPICIVVNVRRTPAEIGQFLAALYAQLPTCSVLVLSEDPHLQAMLAWESLNIRAVIRTTADPGDVISRIAAIVDPDMDSRPWPKFSVPVNRTIDYLSGHFGDELGVSELAEVAGLSASHLAHLFRAETGLAVHEYLTRVRVEVARDLLAHTEKNLSEIAAFVGFFDASHLSRTFRQINGKRPSVYRRSRNL